MEGDRLYGMYVWYVQYKAILDVVCQLKDSCQVWYFFDHFSANPIDLEEL